MHDFLNALRAQIKAYEARKAFIVAETVYDVPVDQYYDAKCYLELSGHLRAEWNAQKDRITQTYEFYFENADDAFHFRMWLP